MSSPSNVLDVIIVGAGPAGCALALSLARCAPEISLLVISDVSSSAFKIGESLPPEAAHLLYHLHTALPKTLAAGAKEGQHVTSDGIASAWGSHVLEERHSILNPFGHGWHLDRAAFDETLRQTLQELRGRSCMKPGRFTGILKDGDLWTVDVIELGSCHSYEARWIIDATGRKASVATKLGAKTIKLDDLLAFYAVFCSDAPEGEEDVDRRTVIESTATGWWYTSLLPRRRRVVVYHTDSTSPTAKLARRRPGFENLLREETLHISSIVQDSHYNIDDTLGTNFPQCTAAGSSSLLPSGNEEAQWYAIGDAAMAFDPLSAQGMMTALEMGFFVGKVLGARLTGKAIEGVADAESMGSVEKTLQDVWFDYEKKKVYYYGTETRFDTDFWRIRRDSA